MVDEKKGEDPEGDQPEKTGEDNNAGNKYETTPIIERARQEREGMEAANKKKEELLNREEAMMATKALGGGSEAGQPSEEKKETPQEYVKREFAWMK